GHLPDARDVLAVRPPRSRATAGGGKRRSTVSRGDGPCGTARVGRARSGLPVGDRPLETGHDLAFVNRGLSPMPSQSGEGQTILEVLGLPTETCREGFS